MCCVVLLRGQQQPILGIMANSLPLLVVFQVQLFGTAKTLWDLYWKTSGKHFFAKPTNHFRAHTLADDCTQCECTSVHLCIGHKQTRARRVLADKSWLFKAICAIFFFCSSTSAYFLMALNLIGEQVAVLAPDQRDTLAFKQVVIFMLTSEKSMHGIKTARKWTSVLSYRLVRTWSVRRDVRTSTWEWRRLDTVVSKRRDYHGHDENNEI